MEDVDAFYKSALASGGKCNGEPGFRPQYEDYDKTFDRNSGIDFLSSRFGFIRIIRSPVITD